MRLRHIYQIRRDAMLSTAGIRPHSVNPLRVEQGGCGGCSHVSCRWASIDMYYRVPDKHPGTLIRHTSMENLFSALSVENLFSALSVENM